MTNYNLHGDGLPDRKYDEWRRIFFDLPNLDQSFRAGWDAALAEKAEESSDLAVYEELGTPEGLKKAVARAQILADYVDDLPTQIRRAWQSYLKDKDAL